jgi:hypothetical protein
VTELALVHPSTHKADERDLEVCRGTGDRAVGRPSHNRNSGEPRQHPRCAVPGDRNVGGRDQLLESLRASSIYRGRSVKDLLSSYIHRASVHP